MGKRPARGAEQFSQSCILVIVDQCLQGNGPVQHAEVETNGVNTRIDKSLLKLPGDEIHKLLRQDERLNPFTGSERARTQVNIPSAVIYNPDFMIDLVALKHAPEGSEQDMEGTGAEGL